MNTEEKESIRKIIEDAYNKAKENLEHIEHRAIFESAQIVSDNIPGYSADRLEFGSYDKDNFAVLFIDMRSSTKRAKTIGPEKTFVSMHAFIAGMLEVIKNRHGVVIDITGDGLMVFFGGKNSELSKCQAVQNAGMCGREMLDVINTIINPMLEKDKIWKITCGVGIDYGDVIVTKIGINDIYDVKALGDCINKASKYSDIASNEVIVSKQVRELWPSSKGGLMRFKTKDDGYILTKGD